MNIVPYDIANLHSELGTKSNALPFQSLSAAT